MKAARTLDKEQGREEWKNESDCPYYDYHLFERLIVSFKKHKESGNVRAIMKLLMTIFSKSNFGGLDNEELYSECYWGTKLLIHDFITHVMEATIIVRDSPDISTEEKLKFFKRCKRTYGRSALALSGGAGFGYYHIGVIKTLYEANCLPKVISGTSAGAMIASLVG